MRWLYACAPYILKSTLAVCGAYIVYAYAQIVLFPYDIANGEGFVLRDAVWLYYGRPIYEPIDSYPFVSSGYPPLFAWLAAQLMHLTGPSFVAPRLLSALAYAGLAITIGLIVRNGGGRRGLALLAAFLFATSLYVFYWGAWSRVDVLAAWLSLGAVAVVRPRQPWRIALAALLCVLAFYTKQSALAAGAAITLYLAGADRRGLAVFLGVGLGLGGLAFWALNAWSDGEFFNHIVRYNQLLW